MKTIFKHNILLPLFILGVPFLAFSAYRVMEHKYASLPYFGNEINDEKGKSSFQPIPAFSFINQDSVIISNKDVENKITIFNFFFSNCSSVCPRMMRNETVLADAFAKDNGVKILSITVDPSRDSVKQLKTYCEQFNAGTPQWELLTGNKKDIYRFARKGLFITVTDGDGGENDFIHSDMLVLVDSQGKIRGYYKGIDKDKVNLLIQDIKKLERFN